MRCDLSLFAAGLACMAPVVSAQWGTNTPEFTTPGWTSTPTASPTWGTIASSGWGAKNTSGPWATGGTTAVVSKATTWHSAPVPTSPQPTWNSPVATSTGGAAAMASSFAGLVFAGGVAVLAL